VKHLKYYAHNSDFCLSFGNRIDRRPHVSICLRGRRKNAKTANIRDITEQIIAVNSNASVNASRIIEIFVTNRDAMQWGRASCRFLSLIRPAFPALGPTLLNR
jgi:hypothetical protein